MSWPVATVGEVCEVVSGATPRTGKPEFWDGNVPWVTPKDLSELGQKHLSDTPRKITKAGLKSCSARMLPAQSVLLSSRAPIGLVAINTLSVCTNQGFKSLVPRFDLVSPDFLFWWLKAQEKHIQSKGRGATFKEISKKIVEDLQIPLPPLAEQERIAGILDVADAVRTKRREALAQLDTLLQSTFLDMFGDPVTNPMGWDTLTLDDVTDEVYRYPTYFGIDYEPKGVPEIRGELIGKAGKLDTDCDRLRFISQTTSNRFPRTRLIAGDLVMSVRGTIGKVGIVPPELCEANITANLIRISPNRSKISPVYLLHVALGRYFVDALSQASSSTTIKTIKASDLKAIPIPLPPLERQGRFGAVVESVERQKASQRAHLAELDTLFASLQSRAFRGDL